MGLGGRPPEEGRHKATNLSLNLEARQILVVVRTNYMKQSTFAERAIIELAAKPSFSAWFSASAQLSFSA